MCLNELHDFLEGDMVSHSPSNTVFRNRVLLDQLFERLLTASPLGKKGILEVRGLRRAKPTHQEFSNREAPELQDFQCMSYTSRGVTGHRSRSDPFLANTNCGQAVSRFDR